MRRRAWALFGSVVLLSIVAAPGASWSQDVADRVEAGARLFEAGQLHEAKELLLAAERDGVRDALVYYYLGRIAFAE